MPGSAHTSNITTATRVLRRERQRESKNERGRDRERERGCEWWIYE